MSEGAVFHYDPEPNLPLFDEGVTRGWLVISDDGQPGPALIADAAVLCDSQGVVTIERTSCWTETTVVDDRKQA